MLRNVTLFSLLVLLILNTGISCGKTRKTLFDAEYHHTYEFYPSGGNSVLRNDIFDRNLYWIGLKKENLYSDSDRFGAMSPVRMDSNPLKGETWGTYRFFEYDFGSDKCIEGPSLRMQCIPKEFPFAPWLTFHNGKWTAALIREDKINFFSLENSSGLWEERYVADLAHPRTVLFNNDNKFFVYLPELGEVHKVDLSVGNSNVLPENHITSDSCFAITSGNSSYIIPEVENGSIIEFNMSSESFEPGLIEGLSFAPTEGVIDNNQLFLVGIGAQKQAYAARIDLPGRSLAWEIQVSEPSSPKAFPQCVIVNGKLYVLYQYAVDCIYRTAPFSTPGFVEINIDTQEMRKIPLIAPFYFLFSANDHIFFYVSIYYYFDDYHY